MNNKGINMTQEEKQLLLSDICARLPYKVNIQVKDWTVLDAELKTGHIDRLLHDEIEFKPYLRPMSSMTEDEIKEWDIICVMMHNMPIESISMALKFVNSKHLDYNNLIPKDLALPAPEGMYEKIK